MIVAPLLASLVCAATPVHGEPLPRSGTLRAIVLIVRVVGQ